MSRVNRGVGIVAVVAAAVLPLGVSCAVPGPSAGSGGWTSGSTLGSSPRPTGSPLAVPGGPTSYVALNPAALQALETFRALPGSGPPLIRAIVARLDPDVHLQVDLGPDPTRPTFAAQVSAPSVDDGGAVYAAWMASLAQGAFEERVAATPDLRDTVEGTSLDVRLPDGRVTPYGNGAGDVAAGQFFSTPGSEAEIVSDATAAVRAAGLEVRTARVFTPLQDALALVVVSPTAAGMAGKAADLMKKVLGFPYRFEGLYFVVELPDGTKLLQVATDYRTGAGSQWANAALKVDTAFPHG